MELERVVSESRLLGPVAVLGDFNAHLGLLEGESQNLQETGRRWRDDIDWSLC